MTGLLLLSASEEDWRNRYKNVFGTSCCGINDCKVLTVKELTMTRTDYTFMYKNRLIPANAIHISEDGQIYGCVTGCLFIPAFS